MHMEHDMIDTKRKMKSGIHTLVKHGRICAVADCEHWNILFLPLCSSLLLSPPLSVYVNYELLLNYKHKKKM